MSAELDGIDVSHWQGNVDWEQAKAAIGFAMLKVTQGVDYVDPSYAANITALRQAGERRGTYHYPNGGDPKAEAAYYVHHSGRQNGEMQALDFEGAILDHPDPVGWAATWLAEVFRLSGNRPLIYMSGSVCTRFDWTRVVKLDTGLWVASWQTVAPTHLGAWRFAIMWQRDDNGHLAGIHGNVDQDVFFGDSEHWAAYANNVVTQAPPPAPVPSPKPPTPPTVAGAYTVKSGDTLWAIGHAHGVTVAQLVAANEHRYPSLGWNEDLIQIGWQFVIPGGHAPAAKPPARPQHTVVSGDTLSELAGVYKTTVAELVQLNATRYPSLKSNPDHIEVGWVLTV